MPLLNVFDVQRCKKNKNFFQMTDRICGMKKMDIDKKDIHILMVDDEPVNRKILSAMLTTEGYNVLEADNGFKALELLEEHPPDIILLDVMMPEMDGFEVCRRIKGRKDLRLIPVLMVTALQDKIHRQQALEAGADDFLSKPIDRTELIIRVKSLVRIKHYSDELLESNRLLEVQQEKLKRLEQAKEALTHMIVHDLRGPLTSISMNIDMCLMNLGNNQNLKRYLEHAGYQCRYLDTMIQGLLDIYKMEKGRLTLNRQWIRPEELLKEVANRFLPQLESKNIVLVLDFPSQCPTIHVDPELISRVLGNLLDNAIRHTPGGGHIELGLTVDSERNAMVFSVADSGSGLDEKYHKRIFDRFEQINLKKEGVLSGGVGLGLNFCKMAVELHGGEIWVANKSNDTGCVFSFCLPLDSYREDYDPVERH